MSGSRDDAPFSERLTRGLRRARRLQPVALGTDTGRIILETEHARLHAHGGSGNPPLLMVYSLVNRAYLLDLQPGRSVVERLGEAGIAPYVLDWQPPDSMARFATLEDHIGGDLAAAVAAVTERHGAPPHVAGVCQGGVLALCYAALFPRRVRSLTLLATPVDFHTPGDTLARLSRGVDFERLVDATGNVPASALNWVFTGLRPFQILLERYGQLADIADDDEAIAEFLRMERWMYDSPDQAGAAFVQFARELYQRNALARGTLRLFDRPVDPAAIDCPVFSARARHDHLVPEAAAAALPSVLGRDDVVEHVIDGGHLGLFLGRKAHAELYPALARWLLALDEDDPAIP